MKAAHIKTGELVLRSEQGHIFFIDKEDARYRMISKAMAASAVKSERYEHIAKLLEVEVANIPHAYYDKGWVPGPNANWQKRSPDEMARSLPKRDELKHRPGKDELQPQKRTTQLAPSTPANTPPAEAASNKFSPALKPRAELEKIPLKPTAPTPPTSPTAQSPAAPASATPPAQSAVNPAEVGKMDDAALMKMIGGETPPAAPAATPDPMAAKKAEDLFQSLKGGNTGVPNAVKMAARKVMPHASETDMEDLTQIGSLAVFQAFQKGVPADPEALAYTSAYNAIASQGRGESAKKRGGAEKIGAIGETDVAAPSKAGGEQADVDRRLDMQSAIEQLNPDAQAIAKLVMEEGATLDQISKKLGMDRNKVHRTLKSLAPIFENYEKQREAEKTRYVHGPVQAEVFAEILSQARQYGQRGPDFVRACMEAMGHADGQWEAIQLGRQKFLGGTRYEYGPRHQPVKRIVGAVARLEALAAYAGEIDDEALEDEVKGIAREFSAEDLKQIAREFGVKKGISTKAKTLDSLLAKVCEGKE